MRCPICREVSEISIVSPFCERCFLKALLEVSQGDETIRDFIENVKMVLLEEVADPEEENPFSKSGRMIRWRT